MQLAAINFQLAALHYCLGLVLQQYTVLLALCEETDIPDMYVANVKMTAVATVVVEEWERANIGDQMIVVSVCGVKGVQNAHAMRLHHSIV